MDQGSALSPSGVFLIVLTYGTSPKEYILCVKCTCGVIAKARKEKSWSSLSARVKNRKDQKALHILDVTARGKFSPQREFAHFLHYGSTVLNPHPTSYQSRGTCIITKHKLATV